MITSDSLQAMLARWEGSDAFNHAVLQESPRTNVFNVLTASDDFLDRPVEDFDAIPDRSVWRSCLAHWSDDRREQWGLRANELEEVHGFSFPESEYIAFREMISD